MNVHVVTRANQALYARELDAMHRLRHQLFVEEMGWDALRSDDGLEIDEFDDCHAVYLIVCEAGEVLGSMRLLPTWRRCMLLEVFPHFLDEPCPAGPDVWEWTRYCPGLLSRPRDLVQIRRVLLAATLEFALSRGVDAYLGFGEANLLGQCEELGWSPRPLSLPRPFAEGMAMAMTWKITPTILETTRRLFGLSSPVMVEAPAYTGDIIASFRPQELDGLLPVSLPSLRRRKIPGLAKAGVVTRSTDLAIAEAEGTA